MDFMQPPGGKIATGGLLVGHVWRSANAPPFVIPSAVKRSRGIFPSGRFYLVVVLFCHVVDSSTPVGMTQWGDVCTDSPFVSGIFHAAPLPSSVRATPCQLPPREALVPCFRGSGLPVRREGKAPRPSPSGKGDRHRRWMRCGTTFRIVETTGAEVKHIEKPTLALPLGELSPQVTERALRRFLNENVHLNHQR